MVVDGAAQILLTTEVTLGRLDRDVPEQELDLIQFSAGKMAEPGTTATEVVRCQFRDFCLRRASSEDLPQHLCRHSSSPNPTGLVDRPTEAAICDATSLLHLVDRD